MSEFDLVNDEFENAVEIRKELNGVLWKDYQSLKVLFSAIYGEPASLLKTLSDMNYYLGGYPSPDSPSRISAFSKRFGAIAKYYSLLGRLNEINSHLAEFGVRIEPIETSQVHISREGLNAKKVSKHLDRAIRTFNFQYIDDPKEMLEWFLNQTKALQREICQKADQIKIDLYSEVETKLEEKELTLGKGGFTSAVNAVANKRLKTEAGKDTQNVIAKALIKSDNMETDGEFLRERIEKEVK